MAGYALLGACWLVIKTEGELQQWARTLGRRALVCTVAAIGVVSLWTPFVDPLIAARWFSWPDIVYLSPVPVITAALVWGVWSALDGGSDYAPFTRALALFVMCYLGIAISRWPMIVPGHFTLEQAAASESSQAFLLVGTLFLLPTVLIYTAWSYWVFRGKVSADAGYH
jgi:cytochrome d ubiquinol oxidase subunit II